MAADIKLLARLSYGVGTIDKDALFNFLKASLYEHLLEQAGNKCARGDNDKR